MFDGTLFFFFFKVSFCCKSGNSTDHVSVIICFLFLLCVFLKKKKKKTSRRKWFKIKGLSSVLMLPYTSPLSVYLALSVNHVICSESGHLISYLSLFEQKALSTLKELTLFLLWMPLAKLAAFPWKGETLIQSLKNMDASVLVCVFSFVVQLHHSTEE